MVPGVTHLTMLIPGNWLSHRLSGAPFVHLASRVLNDSQLPSCPVGPTFGQVAGGMADDVVMVNLWLVVVQLW